MADAEPDGSMVSKNGWRQGSILPPSLVDKLVTDHQIPVVRIPRSKAPSGWLPQVQTLLAKAKLRKKLLPNLNSATDQWVVVSQDCDLVQPDWEKEPFVELIRIRPADPSETAGYWLENPRQLLFNDPLDDRSSTRLFCSIHDRVRIDKTYFVDHKPDPSRSLSPENVQRICRWITRRYTRAAFPDTFNQRVSAQLRSLAARNRELDKGRDLLTAIYMLVSDVELSPEQDYEIIVWGAMRPADFEDTKKRGDAQKLLDQLEATLGKCDGITINECEIRSAHDISLDDMHKLKRWDFDVLSLRPKTKRGTAPSVSEAPTDI